MDKMKRILFFMSLILVLIPSLTLAQSTGQEWYDEGMKHFLHTERHHIYFVFASIKTVVTQ